MGKVSGISKILHLETVDSTNLEARRQAMEGAEDGLLILCDNQTAGRGRLGRRWSSTEAAIAMSLLLRPEIDADRVSMVTIIAAMAVRDAIFKVTGLETDIKWPNDIKYHDRKLAGILSESVFRGKEFYTVLGIGINVNNEAFPDEIKEIASSLRIEAGRSFDKDELTEAVWESFFGYYGILLRDKDLRSLTEAYNRSCITEGGINEYGELIMADGSLKRSGEV